MVCVQAGPHDEVWSQTLLLYIVTELVADDVIVNDTPYANTTFHTMAVA